MPEVVTLTTPVVTPARTTYRVSRLDLQPLVGHIYMQVVGNDGSLLEHTYTGSTALTFMSQLNTANLTSNSLQKRILTRLIADGLILGAVSGTPD